MKGGLGHDSTWLGERGDGPGARATPATAKHKRVRPNAGNLDWRWIKERGRADNARLLILPKNPRF
ncbi:hypothetical protein VITFI_CDS2354 [Vitreoscilla filiformis]|uniref:Uncharacterized protein n=1 Tax=Vitreoscilla filiformis TaxID=63 RepID=A0A221KGG1_VITFI|nr:hypothetical protein VITFI_CDS2354 [Vitreoscilla filiformis]